MTMTRKSTTATSDFLSDVDPEEGEVTASFDGRSVTYGFGELDALVPAYAASIHKSQGSEYPTVVIPVMTQHFAMLSAICSTPASPAASGLWFRLGRRRLLPSRRAMSRAGGGGQSSRVAERCSIRRAAKRHGELSHGCRGFSAGSTSAAVA